jgi:ABC-2 type transport system permease protein
MLPLLVLVLAIGSAARTFAGEEDAGRLELPLAYPLRRRDSVLAKGAAAAVEVLVVSAAAFLVLAVFEPLVGFDLSLGRIAAAVGSVAVLGIFFGWLALAVGAAVPSRALAIVVPAAIAAAGYLVNGLHDLVGWLEPFRFLSPTWIAGANPLQDGVRETGLAVLLVLATACLVAGALLLERRDLKTP